MCKVFYSLEIAFWCTLYDFFLCLYPVNLLKKCSGKVMEMCWSKGTVGQNPVYIYRRIYIRLSDETLKPRSWLSVVIKNPMALLVKSRGVTPVSWPISLTGPCQSWPPNNPHQLDWLYLSLLSTCSWCVGERTGAVVLWLPSHHPSGCCTLVVVERDPPHDCKALGVYGNTQ